MLITDTNRYSFRTTADACRSSASVHHCRILNSSVEKFPSWVLFCRKSHGNQDAPTRKHRAHAVDSAQPHPLLPRASDIRMHDLRQSRCFPYLEMKSENLRISWNLTHGDFLGDPTPRGCFTVGRDIVTRAAHEEGWYSISEGLSKISGMRVAIAAWVARIRAEARGRRVARRRGIS